MKVDVSGDGAIGQKHKISRGGQGDVTDDGTGDGGERTVASDEVAVEPTGDADGERGVVGEGQVSVEHAIDGGLGAIEIRLVVTRDGELTVHDARRADGKISITGDIDAPGNRTEDDGVGRIASGDISKDLAVDLHDT